MNEKSSTSAKPWIDPDDAEQITAQWVAQADRYHGEKLVQRGRPQLPRGSRKAEPKLSTTPRSP